MPPVPGAAEDEATAAAGAGRPRSPSRREERRRQQELLRALHVLDAAEEVFAAKGYVGATIREISEQAEISTGAIYNLYSGGKEEIFTAVISRRTDEIVEILDVTLRQGETPRQRMHTLIDEVLAYYADHATFYHLFQRAIGGDWLKFEATASDTNWQQYQAILDRYAGLFRQGIEAGELLDEDPAAMAVMFAGLMQAYLAHRVVGLGLHGPPIDDAFPPDRLHALVDRAFAVP